MSAWLVSNYHVNALATFAADQGLTNLRPADLALQLWLENRKSLRHRYPNDADECWGLKTLEADFCYQDVTLPNLWHVVKGARCYAYQSCEHPGWAESSAKAVCDRIQARAFDMLGAAPAEIESRHGHRHYDAAPWGLDDPQDVETAA